MAPYRVEVRATQLEASPIRDDPSTEDDILNPVESAIEREIRLAQEREEELRRQHNLLTLATPEVTREEVKVIHRTEVTREEEPRVSHSVNVSQELYIEPYSQTTMTSRGALSPQSYREMTEVDRAGVKQESIIEREIKEQMAREQELRRLHGADQSQVS